MRYCKFTPYLSSYSGDHESLKEHVRICPACEAALQVLKYADQQSAEKTPDCPDGRELAFYVNGALPSIEAEAVSMHIASCGRCLRATQSMVQELRGEHACESALERATREIQAHALARDLALWLSTEAYPREEAVVRESFEIGYEQFFESATDPRSAETPSPEPQLALSFSGRTGATVAQRINLLSAYVGYQSQFRFEDPGRLAAHLRERKGELLTAGYSERMLTEIIKWLE